MAYVIYGLFDPREPDKIRYIGFTNRMDRRLKAHFAEAKKERLGTYKLNWIRSLMTAGVTVQWKLLDVADGVKEAGQREIELIQQYRDAGAPLTNTTKGGDGSVLWTPSMHDIRSTLSQQYWSAREAREQQRQAMQTFWASSEGAKLKETHRYKTRAQMIGTKRSAETREKMRQRKLGKPQMPRTPEWKAKIAAAQAGKKRRPWTEDERARHMAGMNHEKMSASAKARHAKSQN